MKKHVLVTMGVLMLAAVVGLVGCATGAKGPSAEEGVKAAVDSWKAAVLSKNVDKMLACFSESFAHKGYEYEAANKAALKDFVKDCDQMGYFSNAEISLDTATTTVNGDTATVSGIQYTIDQGTATIDLTLKNEKAGWLVTDMAVQGM